MRVAAPRDAATLREELAEAVAVDDGPTAVRFPKGAGDRVGARGAAPRGSDWCRRAARAGAAPDEPPPCCWSCAGAFGELGGGRGDSGWPQQGMRVTVVDPRWVLPVPPTCWSSWRARHRLVVTVADSGRHGGFGSALVGRPARAECDVPQRDVAIPQEFLEHGSRADLLAAIGLTAQDVARRVTEWAAALSPRCPAAIASPTPSRRADAGAGRRGRAPARRRRGPGAAPRGHGRRRRLRRRRGPREVRDHPLRRRGARPRPAGDARRRAVRPDRGFRRADAGADAHRERHPRRQGRRAVPRGRRLPGQAVRLPGARGALPGPGQAGHPRRAADARGGRRRARPGQAHGAARAARRSSSPARSSACWRCCWRRAAPS